MWTIFFNFPLFLNKYISHNSKKYDKNKNEIKINIRGVIINDKNKPIFCLFSHSISYE